MPHALFGPEVRLMLEGNHLEEMKVFLGDLHPATIAETLSDELTVEQTWKFLENTGLRNQAAIFEYFPIDWQIRMAEGAGKERMAHLIEKMSHDDRVDLMRRLSPRVVENLLRLVDEADRRDIATLVRQDPETAGGLMTTDYAWLPQNLSATEALERLRVQAPESETIYYIFILDEQRRLLGVLSLRNLILAPRHALVKDLMETQFVSARVEDDKNVAADLIARYDLLALPVVDESGRLVGIVTHDDVIDLVVQEATEDAHKMGGVGPLAENYMEAGFFTVWRKRAFWLSCLFGAELFTFTAMASFDDELKKITVLAFFIPLCISTGGNSGSQAATLITRAMALGQVKVKEWRRILVHELLMGIALGAALGGIGFIRGAMTSEGLREGLPWHTLGWIIASSVMCICIWGTLVGSMLPIVFKRVGVDPGIASSPFVATFVDVTGIVIFFSFAKVFATFPPM
ncbi:MAG: magnesium transporter [Gemmataceae bacterium]|nr:magnesium transporter [Gemmataceae bacterium]